MPSLLAPPQKPHSSRKRVVDRGCGTRFEKQAPSPHLKRDLTPGFTKSLLSLVLVLSFFQQSVERSLHFSGAAQNTSGTCFYAYGDHRLLTSRTTPAGASTLTRDARGNVIGSALPDGSTENLTWDNFGRLVRITQSGTPNNYSWSAIYDGLGHRIQTTSQGSTLKYYYDPDVEHRQLGSCGVDLRQVSPQGRDEWKRASQFLELGCSCGTTTVKGWFASTTTENHSWNLYGPDRSGTYGGAQGIGGLETEYNQNNGGSHALVNNTFGDALGLMASGTFTPYSAILGGYGAMPGSPEVNKDLQPQWRGHYLDGTGLYYFGARYYEPENEVRV